MINSIKIILFCISSFNLCANIFQRKKRQSECEQLGNIMSPRAQSHNHFDCREMGNNEKKEKKGFS